MARKGRPALEWADLLKDGEKYRKKFGYEDDWEKYWRFYRRDYADDRLPVNMIFAIGRSIVPRVYFRNPRVIVTPRQPGMYLQAKVQEKVDNIIIQEMGVKQAMKATCLDAYLYGTGVIKRGYDSEFGFDPESAEDSGGALSGDTQMSRSGGEKIEYNSSIRSGWPWVMRINPKQFVVPWGARDIQSAPWVAHQIIRPVEDVKNDPKYAKSVAKQVTGSLSRLPAAHESTTFKNEPGMSYVRLWEIYDGKTGRLYVLADGMDKYLYDDDDPFSSSGFPFHGVVFNSDEDHFWGISDCRNIEPQQLELLEVKTAEQRHRKLALLRFLYNDSAIEDEEMAKFLDNDIESTGIGIKVKGDLNAAIMPIQPHVPQDYRIIAESIRQDMRELTGFSRNQLGEYDTSSRRTATEAAYVAQAVGIRVDERRDVLADVLLDIMHGVNDYIHEWWSEQHVAQIVGPAGQDTWVSFTGEDLRGQYGLRTDPDQALPVSAEVRRAEAEKLVTTAMGIQGLNVMPLLRHWLTQFEGIEIDEVLPQPAAPPQAGIEPTPIGELAANDKLMAMLAQGGVQGA
jgi:hypothetical protein